jgi:hypothetical protein
MFRAVAVFFGRFRSLSELERGWVIGPAMVTALGIFFRPETTPPAALVMVPLFIGVFSALLAVVLAARKWLFLKPGWSGHFQRMKVGTWRAPRLLKIGLDLAILIGAVLIGRLLWVNGQGWASWLLPPLAWLAAEGAATYAYGRWKGANGVEFVEFDADDGV